MCKIKYVQLEPSAFLSDPVLQSWTAEEFGVYSMLIMFLYCGNGRMLYDIASMARATRCDNIEKVWEKVKVKFRILSESSLKRCAKTPDDKVYITHKRVTKELNKAKKLLQDKQRAGLKGAEAKWHSHNRADVAALAKESKEKVIEEKINIISNSKERSLSSSISFATRNLYFVTSLEKMLGTRTISDKSCYKNVTNWIGRKIATGDFTEGIYDRILCFAEAARGAKNPPAAFMAMMKKELDYKAEKL